MSDTPETGSDRPSERDRPALDRRRNAFRPDLAHSRLQGQVPAERYTDGEPAQVMRATVPLRREPDPALGLETEALFGEPLTILDENMGWAWVQLGGDGYVGYVPASALSRTLVAPTHRVKALGTFAYPRPDIKTTPLMHLPLNGRVAVVAEQDGFAALATGGFAIARHLTTADRPARDFVDIAERFVTTPYLWGGRTRIGIDCSGLVQMALQAAGIEAPRDSDMQQAELGEPVVITGDFAGLQRGDLIFWKGHVGIMVDGVLMVHANAHHMMVSIETLPEAAQRNAKTVGPVVSIRRLHRAESSTA